MWSHYAAKHSGLCLGFDLADEIIVHIEYVQERPVLTAADFHGEATGQRNVSRLLGLKHAGWSYEQEVRVGCRLDHDDTENGVYFHEFVPEIALREVILGPLCKVPTRQIERLVQPISDDIVVRRTKLDDTSFRVIADGEL